MDHLLAWAHAPASSSAFALLGEYGMGKTVTLQRFARHLRKLRPKDPTIPLSLYLDLREVTGLEHGVPTLDQIVTEVMKRSWPNGDLPAYTMENFESWISQPAVVIFDGLDEVLVKLSAGDGQTFTRTLLSLAPRLGDARCGRLKIMVSCRTEYFRTLSNQLNHFTGHRPPGHMQADSSSVLILRPFEDGEVRTYLSTVFPGQDLNKILETIHSIHGLDELTRRPYTLSLVARFLPEIELDRAAGKTVYGVSLYRRTANAWLERDDGKHQIRAEDKQMFTATLAARMWAERETSLPIRVIERWFREWLDLEPGLRSRYEHFHPDRLEEDLRAATFLTRTDVNESSTFRFAHTSLQEYFLAMHLVEAIRSNRPEHWALPTLSYATLDFIGQLLAEARQPKLLTTLASWSAPYRVQASENLLAYAVRAIGRGWPVPVLRGLDMRGAQLDNLKIPAFGTFHSPLDLSGAQFRGASLRHAALYNANLDGADFQGANLFQAYFLRCSLNSTRFVAADLVSTVFRDCILTVTEFDDSDIRGAQQLRCLDPNPSFLAAPARFPAAQLPSDRLRWNAIHSNLAVFSPDGTVLATAGNDGTVRLWEVGSGAERTVSEGHTGWVRSAVFSPDGSLVATAGNDGTVRLWEVGSGAERTVFEGHTGWVRSAVFSPDGSLVATAGNDGTVRLLETRTGAERTVFEGHTGTVRSVVFSPDGSLLATAGDDGTVRLWEVGSGAERTAFEGHIGWVRSAVFSPDGSLVATAGDDGTVRLLETRTGAERTVFEGHIGAVRSVVFSPDGSLLATAGDDGIVRLLETRTGAVRTVLIGHGGWVLSAVFSPDGALLATAGDDGTARLWETGNGVERTVLIGHGGWVLSAVFSPDGALLATAGDDGTARLWETDTGVERTVLTGYTGWVRSAVFSPDGALLVTAGDDDTVRLWEADTGAKRTVLIGHASGVLSAGFSPDGALLVTAGEDGTVRLWEADTGVERRVFVGHTGWVRSAAFSPNGALLATAGNDGTVRLWEADTGVERRVFVGHTGWVRSAAFSPDGTTLISAGDDGTVRLWEADTGTERVALIGHTGGVRSAAFSPDGTTLISAGDDGTVRLWEADTGTERVALIGHTGGVRSAAFSPDGILLATAGDDGTARLWDLRTSNALLAFGFVSRDPLDLGGYAVWRPATNKLLEISDEGWRALLWERHETGGHTARLPAEYFRSEVITSC
ncbi:hypothetical protein AS189_09370 [Arthrobacter alpinus]|uniref:NACHT domain-containing protein n=2 Tax=Arthrobacter alpinus TaxID=656366 RepID=A0A0S2LZT0_9MICC|nr:hypothetical protein AS189_09370 [Arthrobacter alpinus]